MAKLRKKNKLVRGVGVNDADYIVSNSVVIDGIEYNQCPYYRSWGRMLERCYSSKYHIRNSSYAGCSVTDDWLTFSNFKNWMMTQDWVGLQLEKDVLIVGNKHYSSTTCVFAHSKVNTFVTDSANSRGDYPIGVHLYKLTGKYKSECRNPFANKQESLGYFTTPEAAHNAWKQRKLQHAVSLSKSEYVTDKRVGDALVSRYTDYSENGLVEPDIFEGL